MEACHVAIAIGGSWHGKRDRLLIAAAGVKTHSDPSYSNFINDIKYNLKF
jgi:hypothetical protein